MNVCLKAEAEWYNLRQVLPKTWWHPTDTVVLSMGAELHCWADGKWWSSDDPIHNHASSLPVMRHEEIRSRRNALSLCHHWFGRIDKSAQGWTVALTQASAPLAAPNQQMKRLWVHSLWPHLKLMRLLSQICRDFPSRKIFKLSSRCEAAPFVTGIQSHL